VAIAVLLLSVENSKAAVADGQQFFAARWKILCSQQMIFHLLIVSKLLNNFMDCKNFDKETGNVLQQPAILWQIRE
jgi:hypothetical protein